MHHAIGQVPAAGRLVSGSQSSYTTNAQRALAVASDANGNFVVILSSSVQDGSSYGVFGQRYEAAGQAFHTVTPCRAVDTRSPAPGTPLGAGVPRTFALR